MENNQFEQLQQIIKSRRSIGWAKMNSKTIPNETVASLLELADWAPTHGRTEPWRFFVYAGEQLKAFSQAHADLYWENTPEDKRLQPTYDRLKTCTDKASHLVVAAMKRGTNPNIPLVEEIAAASAGIQNVLLGATALGIASFWSTGGMTLKPALKGYLGLGEEDQVLGMVFLGYTDEPAKEGTRAIPMAEKAKWF